MSERGYLQVTLEREHQILVEARGHLAKGWQAFDLFANSHRYGNGPVCAHGAILRASYPQETPVFHNWGEYWGGIYRSGPLQAMFERLDDLSMVMFTDNLVNVNNLMGQDSALAVFDARIKQIEDLIANKLIESANQALPEPVLA